MDVQKTHSQNKTNNAEADKVDQCANPWCRRGIKPGSVYSVYEAIDRKQGLRFCCEDCADSLYLSNELTLVEVKDKSERLGIIRSLGLSGRVSLDATMYASYRFNVDGTRGGFRHVYVKCGEESFLRLT